MDPITVLAVNSQSLRRDFLRVPEKMFADDPHWIAPLRIERAKHISPKKPYFAHARWNAWIAFRGREPVGRISAQIDDLQLKRYQDATGFFGMLDCVDDHAVFEALLHTAEQWLSAQGMRRIRGPFNLSINQECGVLVSGFDTPPMIMMGHARPYYGSRIEALGYVPAQDLLAYRMLNDIVESAAMRSLLSKTSDQIKLRTLRRSEAKEDFLILREIFNDAWSENWGFLPFTEDEFLQLGREMLFLIDSDFVQIAELGGEPAAMIIGLPNLNEAIRDLDGKLFPFGWLKLLWRIKGGRVSSARVPLMGVRRAYQDSLVGTALAFLLIKALRNAFMRRGIHEVELSWILESNEPMRRIIESLGGTAYKRYRIYDKDLVAV